MPNSFLNLAGDFDNSKSYLLTGETINQWKRALTADRVIPGPGLSESQTPQGRFLSLSKKTLDNLSFALFPEISGDASNGFKLKVSNGTVQPSANAAPKLGSGRVNDATPPELTITAAGKLYLEIPCSVTAKGASPDFEIDTVTFGDPEFKVATGTPVDVIPSVDKNSGAITNGFLRFEWATIHNVGGVISIADNPESGSCQPIFCPEKGQYTLRFNKSVPAS